MNAHLKIRHQKIWHQTYKNDIRNPFTLCIRLSPKNIEISVRGVSPLFEGAGLISLHSFYQNFAPTELGLFFDAGCYQNFAPMRPAGIFRNIVCYHSFAPTELMSIIPFPVTICHSPFTFYNSPFANDHCPFTITHLRLLYLRPIKPRSCIFTF